MNTLSVKDLRIGNYIEVSFLQDNGEFKYEMIQVIANTIKDAERYGNEWDARPIPLTEAKELLLKAGFKVDKNTYWKSCDEYDHYLELIFSGDYYYPAWVTLPELSHQEEQRSTTNRIQYLHQLQNLWKELSANELTFNK